MSRKRGADSQITRETYDADKVAEEDESGSWTPAPGEVVANRRVVKAKRRLGSQAMESEDVTAVLAAAVASTNGAKAEEKKAAPEPSKAAEATEKKPEEEKKEEKKPESSVGLGWAFNTSGPPAFNFSIPSFGTGAPLAESPLSFRTLASVPAEAAATTSTSPAKEATGFSFAHSGPLFGGFTFPANNPSSQSSQADEEEDETDLGETVAAHGSGETPTGEEEEERVLSVRGKLYSYYKGDTSDEKEKEKDSKKSKEKEDEAQIKKDPPGWHERGIGTVHVNVPKAAGSISRLLMRSDTVSRIILNVSLWPAMPIERNQEKAVCFTAFEEPAGLTRFLVRLTKKQDADDLLAALEKYKNPSPGAEKKEEK